MRKKVLAICGSTRSDSSNLRLIKAIQQLSEGVFDVEIYTGLADLPHFNPDIDNESVPEAVTLLRNKIKSADGILICTPEYVFSLPGSLKNAIEWMVSTTIFSNKPAALITASGLGEKAHESLLLIMKTVEAKFTEATTLHLSAARTKVNAAGIISDETVLIKVQSLIHSFAELLQKN